MCRDADERDIYVSHSRMPANSAKRDVSRKDSNQQDLRHIEVVSKRFHPAAGWAVCGKCITNCGVARVQPGKYWPGFANNSAPLRELSKAAVAQQTTTVVRHSESLKFHPSGVRTCPNEKTRPSMRAGSQAANESPGRQPIVYLAAGRCPGATTRLLTSISSTPNVCSWRWSESASAPHSRFAVK
jgi:hypothetical protein